MSRSRFFPNNNELPTIARYMIDAVSERLGRPAHCRKVSTWEQWYVYDPVISFVQQGVKKGRTGYRVGYRYDADDTIWFILVHSPIMAKLFKRNLVLSTLTEVLLESAEYRSEHFIYRSSKLAFRSGYEKDGYGIISGNIADFIFEIEHYDENYGFVKDLFPTKSNTGKGGGRALVAGNTFYLLLVDKSTMLRTKKSINQLINLTWPLFLCLYPVKAIERRSAGLARSCGQEEFLKFVNSHQLSFSEVLILVVSVRERSREHTSNPAPAAGRMSQKTDFGFMSTIIGSLKESSEANERMANFM